MREINIPPVAPLEQGVDPSTLLRDRLSTQEIIIFRPGVFLLAYMLYPNDAQRRHQFVDAEEFVGQTLRRQTGTHDPAFFERHGDAANLAAATLDLLLPDAMKKSEREWPRTAKMLRRVADMTNDERARSIRGSASLSKATKILENTPPRIQASALKRAWQEYRDVAHFLAAADFITEQANRLKGPDMPAAGYADVALFAPEALLAIAWSYQEFGLSYHSKTKTQPLLPAGSTWRIPGTPEITRYKLPTRRLTEDELAVLKA